MKMRTLIAAAVAGAFAMPLAAQVSVDHDRMILAQASGGAGGATGGGASGGMAPGTGTGAGAATGAPGAGTGTGAATGAPGGTTPATGATAPTATDMTVLDKNNDGYVSRDEAMGDPSMQTRFSELDTDNDGRISRDEWAAGAGSAGTGGTTR